MHYEASMSTGHGQWGVHGHSYLPLPPSHRLPTQVQLYLPILLQPLSLVTEFLHRASCSCVTQFSQKEQLKQ